MEIRVLGPIEVVHGSGPVDLGTRMHRAVLSALVVEAGRVVSLDRLIDSLWGDEPPATATGALHVYISGLRKVLEPDRPPRAPFQVLLTQPPGYVLRVETGAVDVRCFEALAAEGRALLGAGQPADALVALDRALSLWRGPAYEDVAFESFLQGEIARLNGLRAAAAEARVEAMLSLGHHDAAVVDAETMVAEEPLRERRWGLFALALYRVGRQGDALRALERARRTLGEELGVDPGPDLRRLELDILAQSPGLDLRPPGEPPPFAARHVPVARAFAVISTIAVAGSPESECGGSVLSSRERPHGISLTEMGALAAPFSMSGDLADYPDTPIQVLHIENVDVQMLGEGSLATGTNFFTVAAGTHFFVSFLTVNDGPPMVPGFPATAAGAATYFFDPAHYGGRDFEVVVDGTRTTIGAEHLTGPVPIPGNEEERIVTLGTFLGPLSPGVHTITIRGGVYGRGMADTYNLSFVREDFTYTVEVLA